MSLVFSQRNNMMPKCADCGEPIPMEEMMDHVCKPSSSSVRNATGGVAPLQLSRARSSPQISMNDSLRQRPPLPQPARYRPSSPSRAELGRVRTTPSRNPPPPAIQIPQPRSSPISPDRRRAASIRSMGSQRSSKASTSGGLPSGPRASLDEARRPPAVPSRPSNEAMRHRPSRSREEAPRFPFNANSSSNGPKSADALLYRTPQMDMQPPPPVPTSANTMPEGRSAGPVNMAGVGRRGFAAAAKAVMAAQDLDRMRYNSSSSPRDAQNDMRTPPPLSVTSGRPSFERERRSPLDELRYRQFPSVADRRTPPNLTDRRTPPSEPRRANTLNPDNNNYLSTGPSSANGQSSGSGYSMGASTPPLSPALSSPSSPSLNSPISPLAEDPLAPSRTSSDGSARAKLRELREMRDGPIAPAKKSPTLPPPPEKSPPPQADEPVSLLERYKNMAAVGVSVGVGKLAAFGSSLVSKKEEPVSEDSSSSVPDRKSEYSVVTGEEEETMLAYGRDSVVTDSVITDSVVDERETEEKIAFPSVSPPLKPVRTLPLTIRSRSGSSNSDYSAGSLQHQQRLPAKSAGATMDTLLETSEPSTPMPPPTPTPLVRARSKSMPRRTHARNESSDGGKVKFCVKCDKRIEDGRWVRNEGGGVLCEGCWKNLYLPRCRRCDLPIEKGAVSSSDGQLKGKYHRGCFTCYTCQDPFPTKSFYVYENNPYCAYHYHKANNSLCAASSCGEPIEGPCAVAHNGDRFHPEHFTCEWRGRGGCKRSLDEYYEVDGERYCEYHARKVEAATNEALDDEFSNSQKMSRAEKRVTRYISLAGMGGGGLDGLRKKLGGSEESGTNSTTITPVRRPSRGPSRGRF